MSQKVLAPGFMLGRYELITPLAAGGFASVWIARVRGHAGFQKVVALKVMSTSVDDCEAENMFLDEARLASRIEHPNVVETLDLGSSDGFLYQAMEYIEGERVAALAALSSPIPLVLVLHIGMQVCAGLHAAHELRDEHNNPLSLVHRDVSPQNILVTYDGVVKVIDFGVAKAACNANQTKFGDLKGKPSYMSPEQALGLPVDRTTDVFALGIVLYRLSTGVHPFRARDGITTMVRICREPPTRPRSVRPSLPRELEEVLLTALAKDPKLRYPSMLELSAALESVEPAASARPDRLASFMRAHFGHVRQQRADGIQTALARATRERREAPSTPASADGRAFATTAPPPARTGEPDGSSIGAAREGPPARRHVAASLVFAVALGVAAAFAVEEFSTPPARPSVALRSARAKMAALAARVASVRTCPAATALVEAGPSVDGLVTAHANGTSAICIDVEGATEKAYRACVDRGACRPHEAAGGSSAARDAGAVNGPVEVCEPGGGDRRKPTRCLPAELAGDYCRARNMRLLRDAEWRVGSTPDAPAPALRCATNPM
jgi:hypothetical protein